MITPIGEGELPTFVEANEGKAQLLVFSAPWCGPCKAMAPTVDDVAEDYKGTLAVGKIDIDEAPALAAQYAVRSVPTLIVLRDGAEVQRSLGGLSRTRLTMLLDKAIAGETA
ncbi:thioredoxin domain-containing protein [Sphingobium sp. H39-3-25]|uniref:thioredoxin family protein n=1 Tax=Sphingobium arseniciresistens TaxID=3030834 RepID=UPI0023B97BA2|nr:thioredoxin domain-containing protein [Sphingobium arseniciresistens]